MNGGSGSHPRGTALDGRHAVGDKPGNWPEDRRMWGWRRREAGYTLGGFRRVKRHGSGDNTAATNPATAASYRGMALGRA
jgi:hypothetical protein